MPLTIPLSEPTVAVPVAADTHVPKAVAFVSVVVRPTQTDAVPAMAAGATFTVKVAVDKHAPLW
jgi:hypothetical protein